MVRVLLGRQHFPFLIEISEQPGLVGSTPVHGRVVEQDGPMVFQPKPFHDYFMLQTLKERITTAHLPLPCASRQPKRTKIPSSVQTKILQCPTTHIFHQFPNYSSSKGSKGRFGMIGWMRFNLALMLSWQPKMIQTTKITPRFQFLKVKVEKEQNPEGTGGTGGAAG